MKNIAKITCAAVVAAGLAMATTQAQAAKKGMEKCYGIVKAGYNDCANASKTHSCKGLSKIDGAKGEWIYVPKGLCKKIAGGSRKPPKS